MKYIIIGSIVLVLIVVFVVLALAKKKGEAVKDDSTEENNVVLNQADVNMMQGINAGGFAAKEIKKTDVKIPEFKQGEPIGYTDMSHIDNTLGARVANTNNKVE